MYDAVKAQSAARLAIQEKEIAPLEAKVKQLRSQLELRRKNQDEIVDLRVQGTPPRSAGLGVGSGSHDATWNENSDENADEWRSGRHRTRNHRSRRSRERPKRARIRSVHFSSEKQNNEIMKWQATTWQIEFHLNMPGLEPEAVQYAVLDKDPVPAYISQVKMLRQAYQQQIDQVDAKPWKDTMRLAQMRTSWDSGFKDITGANLNLLTKKGTVLSSEGPAGKKWIVTRTVDVEGRPVCWCIPVEVKIGEKIDISFDKSNTFDLQTPYDKAMGKQDGLGDKTPGDTYISQQTKSAEADNRWAQFNLGMPTTTARTR